MDEKFRMATATAQSLDSSTVYEANLVTVLPQDVIEKLAELDLELSEGRVYIFSPSLCIKQNLSSF